MGYYPHALGPKSSWHIHGMQHTSTSFAMCRFFLSTTPFCYGVLGQVNCPQIMCFFRYMLNSWNTYSLPLSIQRHCILLLRSLSTFPLNSLNLESVSDLSFIKYTHMYLKKSSIKVTMYFMPLTSACFIRSKTSEWTKSNGSLAGNLDCS